MLIASCEKACIWGGNYFSLPVSRGWLVWVKPDANGTIGKAELAWTTEDRIIYYISHSIAATNAERNGHPTLKPLRVISWSLGLFPDSQTILDPFAGSGTTLRAAKDLNRKAIGIEREEKYCEIAALRMSQEVLQFESQEPASMPEKVSQKDNIECVQNQRTTPALCNADNIKDF